MMKKKKTDPDRGLKPERTVGDFEQARRERAFAREWKRESLRQRQWRLSLVQLICMRLVNASGPYPTTEPIEVVTHRDRRIVATIIQWLGTNVGWDFLKNALRRAGYEIVPIKKEHRPKVRKVA